FMGDACVFFACPVLAILVARAFIRDARVLFTGAVQAILIAGAFMGDACVLLACSAHAVGVIDAFIRHARARFAPPVLAVAVRAALRQIALGASIALELRRLAVWIVGSTASSAYEDREDR